MSDTDTYAAHLEAEKLAALAEFAAGAGHEINNPLAVISGRAQLLLTAETDPDRRRDLAIIRQQAIRIHEMISDSMHFARPAEPRFERVAINALLTEVMKRAESRALRTGVRIGWQPTEDELITSGDATQLAVALSAILDNAFDAFESMPIVENDASRQSDAPDSDIDGARPSGQIRIAIGILSKLRQPTFLSIAVTDNGPGFGGDVRRHLFDPYFSGQTAGRGLGMGLAKCWRIVNLHGGKMVVDSQPGHGATFTVILPVAGSGKDAATSTESTSATRFANARRARTAKSRRPRAGKSSTARGGRKKT